VSGLRTRNPGPGIRRSRSRDRGFMLRDRGLRLLAAGWSCVQFSSRLFRTRDAVVSRRHSMREAECGPFRHTECRMRREKSSPASMNGFFGSDDPLGFRLRAFVPARAKAGASIEAACRPQARSTSRNEVDLRGWPGHRRIRSVPIATSNVAVPAAFGCLDGRIGRCRIAISQ